MVNSQDIQLVDYYMSECEHEHNYYWQQDRVVKVNKLDSGLTELVLSIIGNCGMSDSIAVTNKQDSIFFIYDIPETILVPGGDTLMINDSISLITETHVIEGAKTWCKCCFTFNLILGNYDYSKKYKFIGKGKEIPITKHRFPIKPISFELLKGDTINYRDLYGIKQRRWIVYNELGLITEDAIYENGYILNGKRDKVYDRSQNLISEWEEKLVDSETGLKRTYTELFYYPSGNLKRKCFGLYPEKCEDFPDEPLE